MSSQAMTIVFYVTVAFGSLGALVYATAAHDCVEKPQLHYCKFLK